jgi:hypothetical protein
VKGGGEEGDAFFIFLLPHYVEWACLGGSCSRPLALSRRNLGPYSLQKCSACLALLTSGLHLFKKFLPVQRDDEGLSSHHSWGRGKKIGSSKPAWVAQQSSVMRKQGVEIWLGGRELM